MKYIVVFVFLFCSACLVLPEPCNDSAVIGEFGNITVCSDTIIPEGIEHAISVVEEKTQVYFPEVDDLIGVLDHNEITIYFIDSIMNTDCVEVGPGLYTCDKRVAGVNYSGRVIYVSYNERNKCLANSSFGHEVIHSIQVFFDMVGHAESHPWPLFALGAAEAEEDATLSVEYLVFYQLMDDLPSCQEDDNE